MTQAFLLYLALLAFAAPAEDPPLPVITLTVRPAAVPVPALKYQLTPEQSTLTPGNAVVHYNRATLLQGKEPDAEHAMWKWMEMAPRELPLEDVRTFLRGYQSTFRELELAAHCEHCDWQLMGPMRNDGFNLLLPEIQRMRTFASFLALRARFEIADGHPDQAIRTLQIGFTLSRHVNQAPTLISALVATAIAAIMSNQLDLVIDAPGSPNLYWALSYLRRPLIDLRASMESERMWINSTFPGLRELAPVAGKGSLSPDQLQTFVTNLAALIRNQEGNDRWQTRLALTGFAAKIYPEARRFLLEKGWSAEQIEAMPMMQAVLLHELNQYDSSFDDMLKFLSIPYWQARPSMQKLVAHLKQRRSQDELGSSVLVVLFLPAVELVYFAQARTDRKIAALRTIEAIRLHATVNGGNLPDRLAEITEVPIPVDPITGTMLEYTRRGDTATLTGPPPVGEQANQGNTLHYTLKVAG